ncbi:MAG: hypothetical protein ACYC3N_03380 [Halothiobacillus sp.]
MSQSVSPIGTTSLSTGLYPRRVLNLYDQAPMAQWGSNRPHTLL